MDRKLDFLHHVAYQMRIDCVRSTTQAGSGHVTSCLSAADIIAVVFFHAMRFDPDNFEDQCSDRFILSSGHVAPLLYAVWKQLGKVTDEELLTLRQFNSVLEGHPTPRFKYNESATGSLGQGLSIGVGMACTAKQDMLPFTTFVFLGDSEMTEGSNWEAIELASYYQLDNLVAIVNVNRLGQSTETIEGHDLARYKAKFEAFGWYVILVDGHSIKDLVKSLDQARAHVGQPIAIIAKTFKGYGLNDFIEDHEGYHGKALPKNRLSYFMQKLASRFPDSVSYSDKYQWCKNLPECREKASKEIKKHAPVHLYSKGEMVATRQAYGIALSELGSIDSTIVSLDAEVKNSTFAYLFEEQHEKRFYQCFIAEQNMIGMGVGMNLRDKKPYISTFAAFFTRAYDQIRMAAIGDTALRLVGSHAGISIGQDGPSQMGLEDIAMMRAIPHSIILYPADAVATHACVNIMGQCDSGISYLRTTRMQTPVIYDHRERFFVGGSKVLHKSKHDIVTVVAAGVTLFEALKAYEMLAQEGIAIRLIDCYSIKPLPTEDLKNAIRETEGRMVTVEDHYLEGGLGQAIAYELRHEIRVFESLAVTVMPRSGTPEELLSFAQIDAAAIIIAVKKIIKS